MMVQENTEAAGLVFEACRSPVGLGPWNQVCLERMRAYWWPSIQRPAHRADLGASLLSTRLRTARATARESRCWGLEVERLRMPSAIPHQQCEQCSSRRSQWLHCAAVSHSKRDCCAVFSVCRLLREVKTHYFSWEISGPSVLIRLIYRACSSAASEAFFLDFFSKLWPGDNLSGYHRTVESSGAYLPA